MPALVTPFDADGDLDLEAHTYNLAFLSEMGIDGFLLAGSNGEGQYLEAGERRSLIEAARAAAPQAHLMVGIMAESVRQALAQVAESGEADSLLVMTPTSLARGLPGAVLAYFHAVVAASPLPAFLYSVPPVTAYSLEVELVAELATHPRVAGMKDSSGDVVRLQTIVDSTPGGFLLYSGASAAVTAALTVGCHGVIVGSLNYAPSLVQDVVDRHPDRQIQARLSAVATAVEAHGIPGVKAAAEAIGLRPGYPRLPLTPVDEATRRALSALVS
jgi:dihydrodipicolinate synthase/N-acetylneuraminate lyase